MSLYQNSRFVFLGAATVALLFDRPLTAALVWTTGVALMHAIEETQGRLWSYFGNLTNVPFLKRLNPLLGFALIVLPAALLQTTAAWNAFRGESVSTFWLFVLIGARLSDALFSHLIPFALSWEDDNPYLADHTNPGLPTACIYVVDGLLLAIFFQAQITTYPAETAFGLIIGAGFFLLVQPTLRLVGSITRWLGL